MAPKTIHRTRQLPEIVRQQRAKMSPEQLNGIPMPSDYSVSAELQDWIKSIQASGELRAALDEVDREDPDLAS